MQLTIHRIEVQSFKNICVCLKPDFIICETYEASGGALQLKCMLCDGSLQVHPTDGKRVTIEASE